MIGEPLIALTTTSFSKENVVPRVMTSGIVITLKIGQSAGKVPKSVLIGHGTPSTTARASVNNDCLVNMS
jgi:hypothetical protein